MAKTSAAKKAIDKAEAKARKRMNDAFAAWEPLRRAQAELAVSNADDAGALAMALLDVDKAANRDTSVGKEQP